MFETAKACNQVEIRGVAKTGKLAFFFDGKRLRYAEKDAYVFGIVKAVDESPPLIFVIGTRTGGRSAVGQGLYIDGNPTIETLEKIIDILETSVDELFIFSLNNNYDSSPFC